VDPDKKYQDIQKILARISEPDICRFPRTKRGFFFKYYSWRHGMWIKSL